MEREPRPPVSTLTVEIPSQNAESIMPRRPGTEASKPEETPAPKADTKSIEAPQGAGVASKASEPGAKAADAAPASKASTAAPKKDIDTKPVPKATRKSAERTVDADRTTARADAGGYVVPLGSFTNQDNVKQLAAKLNAAGVKYYIESVTSGAAAQTRVRAGPFATREAAEKARTQLQGLGLETGPVAGKS